jgi:hypothetical protein
MNRCLAKVDAVPDRALTETPSKSNQSRPSNLRRLPPETRMTVPLPRFALVQSIAKDLPFCFRRIRAVDRVEQLIAPGFRERGR